MLSRKFSSPPKVRESLQDATTQRVIDVRETMVVIALSDISKSREWYSRLFGRGPELEPFLRNVEVRVGGAWVQIVKDKVQDSSWSLQLEVRDLSGEPERLREGGIVAGEIKTVPGVISYSDFIDPDGNTLRWFQVLTSHPKVTGVRD